jgi:hypothetical protein
MSPNSTVATLRNKAGREARMTVVVPVAAYRSQGMQNRKCRCGHDRPAHEHYRRGTDCGLCRCNRYRGEAPVSMLRHWIAALGRRGRPKP